MECCLCKNAIETSKRKKTLHGSSCTAAREVLQMEAGNSFLQEFAETGDNNAITVNNC